MSPPQAASTFTGIAPLATYLAGSDDVKSCLVRYWSYYAYGTPGWSQDACTYNAIKQEAATGQLRAQERPDRQSCTRRGSPSESEIPASLTHTR